MSFNFAIKPWDSDFFGFPVAGIGGEGEAADFDDLLRLMKTEHVKLAYWFFDHRENEKKQIAGYFHGIPVHNRLTHQFDLSNLSTRDFNSDFIEQCRTWDNELFELILECGNFSRFKVDPAFGEEIFQKLYRRWTSDMLANQNVLVYKTGYKINGCAVIEIKKEIAAFHFLAVDPSLRNTGIGRQLTKAAIQIAADHQCKILIAYTHRINAPVWQLLESEGFQFILEESVYHFWL